MKNTLISITLLILINTTVCNSQKLLVTYSCKSIYSDNIPNAIRNTAKKTTTFYTLKIAGHHSEYEYLRTEGISEPVFKTKIVTFKDYAKNEITNVNVMEDPWVGTHKSLKDEHLSNYTTDTVIFNGKKALKLTFSNEKKPNFGYAICDLDLPYPDGPESIHGFPGLVIYYESFNRIYKAVSIVIDNTIKVRTSFPQNIKILSNDDYWKYVMSKI